MSRINSEWWTETEKDPTHLAAADWLVRLQNPEVTLEETLAWQAWVHESEQHAQAFARVEAVSQLLREVRAPKNLSPRELARDQYDASIPLKEWRAPLRQGRMVAIAASLAALACTLTIALQFSAALPWGHAGADVMTTAVGENRTISLSDGSRIVLGGDTRIAVALTPRLREIELSRGEALFTVARDATRPFKVHAGDATVVALGTEFNVRRGRNHAVVAVTEGRVRVEPVTYLVPVALLREFKPKLRAVNLSAGQQTMAGSAGIEAATRIEDLAAATSWRSGQLTFRLQPLSDVLEDVNRYTAKRIVLDDDSLGSLLITGMVTRENVRGWIESLERGFALDAVEEGDRIVLKKK